MNAHIKQARTELQLGLEHNLAIHSRWLQCQHQRAVGVEHGQANVNVVRGVAVAHVALVRRDDHVVAGLHAQAVHVALQAGPQVESRPQPLLHPPLPHAGRRAGLICTSSSHRVVGWWMM